MALIMKVDSQWDPVQPGQGPHRRPVGHAQPGPLSKAPKQHRGLRATITLASEPAPRGLMVSVLEGSLRTPGHLPAEQETVSSPGPPAHGQSRPLLPDKPHGAQSGGHSMEPGSKLSEGAISTLLVLRTHCCPPRSPPLPDAHPQHRPVTQASLL